MLILMVLPYGSLNGISMVDVSFFDGPSVGTLAIASLLMAIADC